MVHDHLYKVKNMPNNTIYYLSMHSKLVKYKNMHKNSRSWLSLSREEGNTI